MSASPWAQAQLDAKARELEELIAERSKLEALLSDVNKRIARAMGRRL